MNGHRRPAALRVVHVINNLVVGGAERFVVLLSDAQRRLGLETEVCALAEPNPLARELAARAVPFTSLGRQRLNDPRLVADLARFVRARRPDVLHTHLFYADTAGRIAGRLAGVRAIVSTEHSTEGAPLSARRRFAMRGTAPLAHRVVAVSEPVRRAAAARLGIDAARIEVIPNGIEIAPWEQAVPLAPAELGVEPGMLLAGSVGRLDEAKGYDVLVESMAQLGDPRLRLLLVGDGPCREALQALVAERGLADAVRFLGWRDDVPRVLAALDVFVLPSRWEGHSMALLEAMAAGRACVVSDIPELASVLGDAGERAQPGDPQALAAALCSLLDDGTRRAALGARARDAVRSFSIDASAARYASVYERAVRGVGRRPGPR